MSKLLRGLVILSMAPMFAAYSDGAESSGMMSKMSYSVEAFGSSTTLGWSTNAKALATEGVNNVVAVSTMNYVEAQDKNAGYGFGAAAAVKMDVAEGFTAMARFALHAKYEDSIALKSTATAATAADAKTVLGAHKTKGMIMTPALLIGKGGFFIGAGYQLAEYEFASITGFTSPHNVASSASSKESMIVAMFRGEAEISMSEGMNMSLFAQAESSLGRKSDTDVKKYMLTYSDVNGAGSTDATESYTQYNQLQLGLSMAF